MASPALQKRPFEARHEGFLRHKRFKWLNVALVLTVVAGLGYVLADVKPRPNGGSWYGYTLGTIGAALIVWLTLLGARKRMITPGFWTLKGWVSAHVYLGLALVAIATLHSGFQFGWNVHTLAYALMVFVVLSGIYGVVAYARLPRSLSANRGETTQPQMLEIIRNLDRQLNEAAQPLDQAGAQIVRLSLEKTRIRGGLPERLLGISPGCGTRRALNRVRKALRRPQADRTAALERVATLLEQKSAVLARTRRHIRIRTLLEVWLYIHVPAAIALLAALTAHIFSVFFYW